MDIKDKVSNQDKQEMVNLAMQCQLLSSLLQERNALAEHKAKEILSKNGLSPEMYALKFDPSQNFWQAELKEGTLVVPNRDMKRAGRNN